MVICSEISNRFTLQDTAADARPAMKCVAAWLLTCCAVPSRAAAVGRIMMFEPINAWMLKGSQSASPAGFHALFSCQSFFSVRR